MEQMTQAQLAKLSEAERTLRDIKQGRIPANHVAIREAAYLILADRERLQTRVDELESVGQVAAEFGGR